MCKKHLGITLYVGQSQCCRHEHVGQVWTGFILLSVICLFICVFGSGEEPGPWRDQGAAIYCIPMKIANSWVEGSFLDDDITSAPNGNLTNIPWITVVRLENVHVGLSLVSSAAGTFSHPDKSELIWKELNDVLFLWRTLLFITFYYHLLFVGTLLPVNALNPGNVRPVVMKEQNQHNCLFTHQSKRQ